MSLNYCDSILELLVDKSKEDIMKNDYWVRFWNDDRILQSGNMQQQVGRSINKVPIDEATCPPKTDPHVKLD